MPRLDRTFSHKDIIRIYDYYLTADEKVMVKKHICEEVIEEDVSWPEIICVPLFEILDMVSLSNMIAVEIWKMRQLAERVAQGLVNFAEKFGWLPYFGEVLERETKELLAVVKGFDEGEYKRLLALREYLTMVQKWASGKCYGVFKGGD